MLSKLYVYNAASRVVNKLEQTSNCQDKCSHYMQSRYTFYICPTYPVYCNLFSSMHHEFFIFVIYIRHRSLIHLLWQKSFLHDSLHDVLHCRATLPMFLAYNLRFYQRRGSFMQMCLNTVFYRGSNICTLLSLSSNQ